MQVVATSQGLGRLDGDAVELLDLPVADLGAHLRGGASAEQLASARIAGRIPLAEVRTGPIVTAPHAVWLVGLNYASKVATTGRPTPARPAFYLKASTALAADSTVQLPEVARHEVDYEGEVAVVVGRRLHDASADEALGAIAAYCAANDLTARDVHRSTGNPTLAKSFPGFLQLGAACELLPGTSVTHPIGVRTTVNGERRQDGSTADLVFGIVDLLVELSTYAVLEPGTILLTGTPAGTGQDVGTFLQPGDEIIVEVGTLPALRTTIALAPDQLAIASSA